MARHTTTASASSPEAIDKLLTAIRRRIYFVRLTERLVLALTWGAATGVCLTGALLLREGAFRAEISRPGLGWVALLLALLPAAFCLWKLPKFHELKSRRVNGVTTLTASLLMTTFVITWVLSALTVALIFAPIGARVPIWSVPVAAIVPFLALAASSVRMITDRAAAIFVDQQVGLQERVSTALEMIHTPAESPFETAFRKPVITSALEACTQVRDALRSRSTRIGFSRLDQRAYAVAALAAVAAAGITFFTPLPAQAKPKPTQNIIAVNQGKTLDEIMQELQKATPPSDKTTDKHLKPLEQAIQQLKQGNMSPLEANAALSEAKEQMRRDKEAMEAADKVQAMLRQMENTQSLAQSAEEMAKSQMGEAENQQGGAQAAENLKNAADDLASKMKSGGMSDADRKNLADNLQNAANQAGADPQLQKSLQNAADAARSGDADKLSQNMQAAGQRMGQQSAEGQRSRDAMQRAMNEIDRLQGQSGGQSSMVENSGSQSGQSGGNQNAQGQRGGSQASNGGQQGQNGQGGQQGQAGGTGSQGAGNDTGNGGMAGNRTNGSGSTMTENAGQPGGGDVGGGLRGFVRVYGERETETSGTTEKLPSRINPLGGGAKGSIEVKGPADRNDPAFKTYQAVLEDAHRRAMEELSRQEIPPQYQDMVKEFYKEGGPQ